MMTEFKKLGLTLVIGLVLIMIHVLIKDLFGDVMAFISAIIILLGAMYCNSITRPEENEDDVV